MYKIAITGNIASGKSAAEDYLRSLGYFVCDTDKITHELLEKNDTVKNEIFEAFKDYDIKDEKGNISREKLGKIVFNATVKKTELEKILHKRIFEETEKLFAQNKKHKLVFAAVPLLFETGSEKLFDKIIFISCNENIRLKRLINRNGYSEEYALKRINAQQKEEEKIKKSDFVVNNEGTKENLNQQLDEIIKILSAETI